MSYMVMVSCSHSSFFVCDSMTLALNDLSTSFHCFAASHQAGSYIEAYSTL